VPNVGHDVKSTRIAPEPVVDCHGRRQRPWPMLPKTSKKKGRNSDAVYNHAVVEL
jgi:hypothetical protein